MPSASLCVQQEQSGSLPGGSSSSVRPGGAAAANNPSSSSKTSSSEVNIRVVVNRAVELALQAHRDAEAAAAAAAGADGSAASRSRWETTIHASSTSSCRMPSAALGSVRFCSLSAHGGCGRLALNTTQHTCAVVAAATNCVLQVPRVRQGASRRQPSTLQHSTPAAVPRRA